MLMDMEVMQPGQQDMDLIDILWNQDIDLGARREVFDYNHRQKEHELQRQRELEEEKRLLLLREQEKALLAQLQLDEETGEYIPRPLPPVAAAAAAATLQANITPLEVIQSFTDESGGAMSFDECLQLLAETFPVEQSEDSSACLDTAASGSPGMMMMSPEQMPLPPANTTTLSPGPMQQQQQQQQPPPQRMSPDLEQAWMELQQCLNMQMEDTLETTTYPLPKSPKVQPSPSFAFYPMAGLTEAEPSGLSTSEFIGAFDGSVPQDNLNHMEAKAPPHLNTDFNSETFCDIFYPNPILEEGGGGQHGLKGHNSPGVSDVPNQPSFASMDLYSLSPGDGFDRGKQTLTAEIPDSDSGVSSYTSPNASSPAKSAYEDGSMCFSDSDAEEMDHNPGSAESDYADLFSLTFQPENFQMGGPASAPMGQPHEQREKKVKYYSAELAEEGGHDGNPFAKDKGKKRSEVRLPRDEQRAKALKIPVSVDTIINLPVDDFNEMMSKHQLNEAQLALVRDIRRRGKNKVAAQNCRKRKMDSIVGLEGELDSLKEEKERLRSQKSRNMAQLREMKQQLNSLYLEVFGRLRDEKGNAYSPSDYSLQQSTNGSVFLVPRVKKTVIKSEDSRASPM